MTAKQTVGIIFRNTRSLSLEYNNWGIDVAERFFEFLGIRETEVYTDLSKSEVIAKFDELYDRSKRFEKEHINGQALVILVRWIGYDSDFSSEGNFAKYNFNSMSWSFDSNKDGPFSSADSDVKFHQYGLTSNGEVINVDSYCVRMA